MAFVDKSASDLYATCATVIPVLFLAAAVQGTYYQALLDWSWEVGGKINLIAMIANPVASIKKISASAILRNLAWAILLVAGAGEFLALYAIYRGSESWHWQRLVVFLSTLALMLVVVVGPPMTYRGAIKKKQREAQEQRGAGS